MAQEFHIETEMVKAEVDTQKTGPDKGEEEENMQELVNKIYSLIVNDKEDLSDIRPYKDFADELVDNSEQDMSFRRQEITVIKRYKYMISLIFEAQDELCKHTDIGGVSLQSYGILLGLSEVCVYSLQAAVDSSNDAHLLDDFNFDDELIVLFTDDLLLETQYMIGNEFVEKHKQQLQDLFIALSKIMNEKYFTRSVSGFTDQSSNLSLLNEQCCEQVLTTIKLLTGFKNLPEVVKEKVDRAYKAMADFVIRPKEVNKEIESKLGSEESEFEDVWGETFQTITDIFTGAQVTLRVLIQLDLLYKVKSEMAKEIINYHNKKFKTTVRSIIDISKALTKTKEDVIATEPGKGSSNNEQLNSFCGIVFSTLLSFLTLWWFHQVFITEE